MSENQNFVIFEYPRVVQIDTNGATHTPSSLGKLIDSYLMEKNGERLKSKYWKEARSTRPGYYPWVRTTTKPSVRSGFYKHLERENYAKISIADLDWYSGQNHWYGHLENYKVKVPIKVDDSDIEHYSFVVMYECKLYYDPNKNENINSISSDLMGGFHTFRANDTFFFCPDNNSNESHIDGYFKFGKKSCDNSKYDGCSFALYVEPYFTTDSSQEMNAFNVEALNITNAVVLATSNSGRAAIEFTTSTKHGLKQNDRVIVRGCTPGVLDIPYENNISFRGIEVIDGEEYKFRVIDPYVKDLIQDGIIQPNESNVQSAGVAYLDTSEFVVFAESLAAAIDFDNLTNDVIEKYGGVETFKREMVSVGDRGKLVGWINEQLQILQFPNSSVGMLYDIDTYRGMISLKRYYKSMNEQLYNGLGIGLGCNRDTTNLTGIEKAYCESNDEPCGCYTLGCMVFQEATDNRLESHKIQTAASVGLSVDSNNERIEFTTDHAHGLATHDNVLIEGCNLAEFNIRTKKGVLVGQDPCKFYVRLDEYKKENQLLVSDGASQPGGKVKVCEDLPSMDWERLLELNSSEASTFIENFSLNTSNSSNSESKLYLPVQGLDEKIKIKKGWGAVLRISLVDSGKNQLTSQWGIYGNNVDYLLGSRDEIIFNRKSNGSIHIKYDKRSGASASIMGDSESNIAPPDGFIQVEILDVRSPYAEWTRNGVVLPSDFGRSNGVAAIDKFIESMNTKFGLSGLSIKGGISLKMAAVLEIALIFELKFGLIAAASLEMNSAGESTLEVDIGVIASAGADLGNIGMKGTEAAVATAHLRRYVSTGRVETRIMMLHLLTPFLGPLAVVFNQAEQILLKQMSRHYVAKDSYSGQISLPPSIELSVKNEDTEVKNKSGALVKYSEEWQYSANSFSVKNKVENDIESGIISTENLYLYNLLKKTPKVADLEPKWYVGMITAVAMTAGAGLLVSGIGQTVSQWQSNSHAELSQKTQQLSDYEKKIHDSLKSIHGIATNPYILMGATTMYGVCSLTSTFLREPLLTNLGKLAKQYGEFSENLRNLGSIKGTFKNLGSIVKSSKSESSLDFEVGGGFVSSYPSTASMNAVKAEIERIEQILNSDSIMMDRMENVLLDQQSPSSLSASSRGLALVAKLEYTYKLDTPRVPLFYGVKLGVEFEFKAYAEGSLKILDSYNAGTIHSHLQVMKASMDSWENSSSNGGNS